MAQPFRSEMVSLEDIAVVWPVNLVSKLEVNALVYGMYVSGKCLPLFLPFKCDGWAKTLRHITTLRVMPLHRRHN